MGITGVTPPAGWWVPVATSLFALLVSVSAMLLILLVTRDLLTLVVVVGIGAVAAGALYWGPALLQQVVAYAEAWMLLFGEAAGVLALVRIRVRGVVGSDDAAVLRALTHVPGAVWILAWTALIGWCVVTAAPMLLA